MSNKSASIDYNRSILHPFQSLNDLAMHKCDEYLEKAVAMVSSGLSRRMQIVINGLDTVYKIEESSNSDYKKQLKETISYLTKNSIVLRKSL